MSSKLGRRSPIPALSLLQSLSAEAELSFEGDRVSVLFAESDFVLHAITRPDGVHEVHWQVAVREPPPGLGTWWADWRTSHAGGQEAQAVLDDLLSAHERVCRLLSEGRIDATVPNRFRG